MRFAAMANIFLLEDDKILSKGISIALKKDEHMVTAVYGYLEALKQYQKQKYDLFLLKTLISDISHQIKTPVAAANTFAQLLGDT